MKMTPDRTWKLDIVVLVIGISQQLKSGRKGIAQNK